MTSIEALSPVFSVDSQGGHFCTTSQGQRNLVQLGGRLAGSQGLVGLYVTESAEPDYQPDPAQHGRVVALVRMLAMPQAHTVQNYPSGCMELRGSLMADRWPVGWPSETVFFSPHGGPVLRDAVAFALHIHDFAGFAGQFLQGPIDLRGVPALRDRLMIEIRHEVARNPAAQVRPF
ncbi:hypothetical protein K9U39_20130 [Rhodoblastus acidophilus]|uniref:Uncharacterized protein n=1 Tax=Candidatus Rhodoblastus alkanivorans TaxID=2954117 RepID=A0ABS9ZBK4_9HYPH|nr:hypothetical protein [Candidatus Rhodoblastus alkanivorans]MCI4679088.1 hypothetical protein [Candidatus Rhodoblastus alkanivorans]MCI4685028.1 hypothetical protein [Candidatus Rhodoblastus alkanivorans]MDI4643204.1 hypothetical protein [Rhodoblastus acidophilus]